MKKKHPKKPIQKVEFLPNGNVKVSYSPPLKKKLPKALRFYKEEQLEFDKNFKKEYPPVSKEFLENWKKDTAKIIRKFSFPKPCQY